jgi:hypothetical protein
MTMKTKATWTAPQLRKLGTVGDVAGNPNPPPVQNNSTSNPKS